MYNHNKVTDTIIIYPMKTDVNCDEMRYLIWIRGQQRKLIQKKRNEKIKQMKEPKICENNCDP